MREETDIANEFRMMKICVIIPAYNNGALLANVVQSVLDYTENVIVINDGSTDATLEVLHKFPGLTIISYEKNVGKGWALRKAFHIALQQGFDYAISMDADGQHFADDLPGFIEKLKSEKQAIIIGARNMEQSAVPGKSSFGYKFSNFWFWVETGIRSPDTQSGFRLYPLQLLKDMTFFTKKYEFEIEVLVRAAWKGIAITSVPVKVFYAPKESRVSHFRPFTDFTRISILNTVFVLISFLYIKPRDLLRSIKKKTLEQFYGNNYSTRKKQTS